jgi:hypothetical protein
MYGVPRRLFDNKCSRITVDTIVRNPQGTALATQTHVPAGLPCNLDYLDDDLDPILSAYRFTTPRRRLFSSLSICLSTIKFAAAIYTHMHEPIHTNLHILRNPHLIHESMTLCHYSTLSPTFPSRFALHTPSPPSNLSKFPLCLSFPRVLLRLLTTLPCDAAH